jgi:hypothetical protein
MLPEIAMRVNIWKNVSGDFAMAAVFTKPS